MRFLGDVPIGRATIEFLIQNGHDAIRSVDQLPATASDAELVRLAVADDRVILCFDLDFAAIVAGSGSRLPSVITFRTRRQSAEYVNERIAEMLSALEPDLARGALVTIDDAGVRVRLLPILHRTVDNPSAGG